MVTISSENPGQNKQGSSLFPPSLTCSCLFLGGGWQGCVCGVVVVVGLVLILSVELCGGSIGECPTQGGGEAQLEPCLLHGLRCRREMPSAQSEGCCSTVGSGEVGAPRWGPFCRVCTVRVSLGREHSLFCLPRKGEGLCLAGGAQPWDHASLWLVSFHVRVS